MTKPGATARKVDIAAWPFAAELARLLDVLDRDGEETRVVGGAVRTALIDSPIHEIDVATTAIPEDAIRDMYQVNGRHGLEQLACHMDHRSHAG